MQLQPTKKVSRWVIIGIEKPSERTKKELGLPDYWYYEIKLNLRNGKLKCDCMGFMVHQHCKHVLKYQKIIEEIIKRSKK